MAVRRPCSRSSLRVSSRSRARSGYEAARFEWWRQFVGRISARRCLFWGLQTVVAGAIVQGGVSDGAAAVSNLFTGDSPTDKGLLFSGSTGTSVGQTFASSYGESTYNWNYCNLLR